MSEAVVEGLQDRYAALSAEFREIAAKQPADDGERPEGEVKRLADLHTKMQNVRDEIKIAKQAEETQIEAIAAGEADRLGKSVDEATSLALTQAESLHSYFIAKSRGGTLSETAASLLNVHPETLRPGEPKSNRQVALPGGQIRMLDTADDARGGFSVPDLVSPMLTSRSKHYNVMREICDVMPSMSGREVSYILEDDTDNVCEVIASGDVQNIGTRNKATSGGRTMSRVILKFNTYSSKRVSLSNEFILDTETQGFITDMAETLSVRMGRGWEMAYAHGAGANGIAGVSNLGYLGANPQVKNYSFGSGNINKTKLTVEVWDDALLKGLDRTYRRGAVLCVSTDTLSHLWHIKDSNGRPAYQPSLQAMEPDRFRGRPVYEQPELDDIGASKNVALYFQPRLFKIRDAYGTVMKMVDSDTETVGADCVDYYAFARSGWVVAAPGDGFAKLTTPAS